MAGHECGSCSGGGDGCSTGGQPEDLKLKENLGRIKSKFVVLSGKGGVGKSTVATNIAVSLSLAGLKVGLLDVDVHGPTVPRVLGLSYQRPEMMTDHMKPIKWSDKLSVMSMGFLLPETGDDAVIWRGPVKMGLIKQFLQDVSWGELDALVVDCPPGTGDEPLSVLQLLGPEAQAVIVTTPQGVSIDDVRRSITFCRQVGNPVFGIVENMSGFVCRKCGEVQDIFGAGGGEELAREAGVRFLGSIPMDPEVVRSTDEGYPISKIDHEGPIGQAFGKIVKPMLEHVGRLQEKTAPSESARAEAALAEGDLTRIVLPVAGGKLCTHFGHCENFQLFTVDNDSKQVKASELLTPPPHEPGVLPKFLAEQGADVVIAGGMGSRAQSLFTEQGIKVVCGVQAESPEDVVADYLAGTLRAGANICDH